MKIDLMKQAGIRLLTGGKFCQEDVEILPALQSKTVAANGTVKADEGYAGLEEVVVAVPVPDGYIVPSGTKAVTANGEHDVTNYEKVSVAVPVPDGYVVPSGTKEISENGSHDVSGFASVEVAVPSEEPVLQTKSISLTANGTYEYTPDSGYDGIDKVSVNVAVPVGVVPSGTKSITANGTYDVTNYASVTVNTPTAEAVEEYDGTIEVV